MAKILVTGSNGFIGKRLVYMLLEKGHEIYALTRMKGAGLRIGKNFKFHLLYGDLKDPKHMDPFPKHLDAAYYLVHSLASPVENIIQEEEQVVHQFLTAIENTTCKQIIFLSGIIEDDKNLSPHLFSRLAVEKALNKGSIPVTTLRSSIIIGEGSSSFEIIRDLVEKLPIMVAPRWVHSMCQPIAVGDVLFYLERALLNPDCYSKSFDIGGKEIFSFKEMLLSYAKFRHLRRYIIDIPFLTPRLSSYWLVFITSVRYSICSYLVESMRQNTRKLNSAIDTIIPHECLSFQEAIELAFQKIAQNEVVSTWMDAWHYAKSPYDIKEFIQVPKEGCLKDTQQVEVMISISELKKRIFSIGGGQGWYSMNWAWKVRGLIDKLVGGIGLNRGRRDPKRLEPGDSVDFWRVILADEENIHLILYAEMRIPGEAWLEFQMDQQKKVLKQIATFRPKGFWGRFYWWFLFPVHWYIFKNMAKAIAKH